MPGIVSAFAARGNRLLVDTVRVTPEPLASREVSVESLTDPSICSASESESESDESFLEDQNAFGVLNDSESGPPTGSKRIFELNDNSIRIELLKDQSVVVLGLYTIWVRSGAVSVYGARLQASRELQTIYAPITHALPQITAYDNADFVLASTGEDLRGLQGDHKRPIWDIPQQTPAQRSFYILGYSFQFDEVLRRRLRILDTTPWLPALKAITKPQSEPQNVLVCGSGCTGKSTFSRVLINRLLTTYSRGVLLLDLDIEQPELSPPGTICLAYIDSYLFGPPLTHVVAATSGFGGLTTSIPEDAASQRSDQIDPPRHNYVVRMHYLGHMNAHSAPQSAKIAISDLVQHTDTIRRVDPGCSLIINCSEWLHDIDEPVPQLIQKMHFSDLVCLDNSPSGRYQKILDASKREASSVNHIRSKALKGAPASTIRWNHLQSYFHNIDLRNQYATWDSMALFSSNRKEFNYSGPDSLIDAIVTLGEQLALQDVAQALEGSIVAVVAMKQFESEHIVRSTVENLPYRQIAEEDDVSGVPDPCSSECVGLVYVVGVDALRETMEVLTPICQSQLSAQQERGSKIALVLRRQDRQWEPPIS